MSTQVTHSLAWTVWLLGCTDCGRLLLSRRSTPAAQATITCPRCQLKTSWHRQLEITKGGVQ